MSLDVFNSVSLFFLCLKFPDAQDFDEPETAVTILKDLVIGSPLRMVCPKHSKSQGHSDFGATHFWARNKGGQKLQNLNTDKENRVQLPNGDFLFLYLTEYDVQTIKSFNDETVQCVVTAGNMIFYSKQFKLEVGKTGRYYAESLLNNRLIGNVQR